eukprot:gnl/MRDRNA2_/MRDRNA2_36372_c0_seq1.p1 gnl/MRDRNA2_/MRDRNA2_36372_c0~~gnl/MRDRNA2_/MRDRNA2_36372_c0_seq1.p1  ORF type:complete len:351 (+),score=63.06 gnl/MRDRNA2_/MRDRNA2_36372_c0_seq1:94-1146(+)
MLDENIRMEGGIPLDGKWHAACTCDSCMEAQLQMQVGITFCLEEALPPGGMWFKQAQTLKARSFGKNSSGKRHSYAQLNFQPDGYVIGKFLNASSKQHVGGNHLEGHRSGWLAQYLVYRGGVLRFYNCSDLPPSDGDFGDTDFNDSMLLSQAGICSDILPLPIGSPCNGSQPLCRWLVGEGNENDCLQAAKKITAVLDAEPSVFQQSDGTFYAHIAKTLNSWDRCPCPVLKLRAFRELDLLTVTCSNTVGEVICTVDVNATNTTVLELREKIHKDIFPPAPPPVLLMEMGMMLTKGMDALEVSKLFSVYEQGAPDISSDEESETETCLLCHGSGAFSDNLCPLCDGMGGY